MTNPGDNWEAENFARTHWTAEAMASEENFRDATMRVTRGVYECYTFDSPYAAKFLYRCFTAAREFVKEEPYISILEFSTATSAGTLANWHICDHKYDIALNIVRDTWSMLDAKDSRRELMGLPPSPGTAARVKLLTALADIKWRTSDEHISGVVLTPRQQIQAWLTYSNRIFAWFGERPEDETKVIEVERLLWAGLHVASCAQRYAPDQVPLITEAFNKIHWETYGEIGLSDQTHGKALEGSMQSTPWFWHYEIAKSWLHLNRLESLSPEQSAHALAELDGLYELLIANVRTWTWARSNCNYLASILRDQNWMRGELKARKIGLELIS